MTETVIPATCADVRAEGPSSAGVAGVVGTAAGGVVGEAVTLRGLAGARELSGARDEYRWPPGEVPLTLARALELVYANGASPVIAVRVAGPAAPFVLKNATGGVVTTPTTRALSTDWRSGSPAPVRPGSPDAMSFEDTEIASARLSGGLQPAQGTRSVVTGPGGAPVARPGDVPPVRSGHPRPDRTGQERRTQAARAEIEPHELNGPARTPPGPFSTSRAGTTQPSSRPPGSCAPAPFPAFGSTGKPVP